MIHVAVIGFGFMGVTHSLNILRNKNLKLQALITRHPSEIPRRAEAQLGNFSAGSVDASTFTQIPSYTSLRECLKREKIDAVHICTHTHLHYDQAREAMELGLHVFLEKPMSLRVEEAELLIHYARQQKVKFMVGHVVRFMPAYRTLKRWVDEKKFGALEFISLTRFSGLPAWGQWKEKHADFGSSGGALFDLVIHDIDYLNYVLGPPGKITAVCHPGMLSMHDYVTAHWHYGTVTAKIEGGNIFHSGFPFQAGFMARFEKASVIYSSNNPECIQVASHDGVTEVSVGSPNEGFYEEIDYFTSCITNNQEPSECSPASSLQTLNLCYDHIRE
jgi:predicted dehydrogenase